MRFIILLTMLLSIFVVADSNFEGYFNDAKKDRFASTILPFIIEENEEILSDRAFVESFFSKNFFLKLSSPKKELNIKKLAQVADKYKINNLYDKNEYLSKIDVIPPSLAMGQAILESGWGSSIYAKKLNNYYGHYVFNKNLGVKGLDVSGKSEQIRVFDDVRSSVRAYMLNLNTHLAYKEFRKARESARRNGEFLGGLKAIEYLERYSIQQGTYISRVKSVIKSNDLTIFDGLVTDFVSPNFKSYVTLY